MQILNTLQNAGFDVISTENNRDELADENGISFSPFISENRTIICTNHYKNNKGFFHIKDSTSCGELVFLKACEHDFVRVVNPGFEITEELAARISKLLNDADILFFPEAIRHYSLLIADTNIFITDAEEVSESIKFTDLSEITKPLTQMEYRLSAHGKNSLLSKSFFSTVFPETISHYLWSILNRYPNILNSLFAVFDADVKSSSFSVVNKTVYANITNMLDGLQKAEVDMEALVADLMPWLDMFKNTEQNKSKLISNSISEYEMEQFFTEAYQSVSDAAYDSFFSDKYYEPAAYITMLALVSQLLFLELLPLLADLVGKSYEDTVSFIYKSRNTSFFMKGDSFNIPNYFDFNHKSNEIKIKQALSPLPKNRILDELPAISKFLNKKKIMDMVNRLHSTLNLRDKILKLAGDYHKKSCQFLQRKVNSLKKEHKLSYNDALLLEADEFQLYSAGQIPDNFIKKLAYRRSYAHRATLQKNPAEIYTKDVPKIPAIVQSQLKALQSKKFLACKSHITTDLEGSVSCQLASNTIYCGKNITLAELAAADFPRPKAIILEYAPVFSYITEYAFIYDIPLLYGVRYVKELLENKQIKIHRDGQIEIIAH